MANYKTEFPDYDDTLPELEGFTDSSWRNDACPSLSKEISDDLHPKTITIFVDYKNFALSEFPEVFFNDHGDYYRFVVFEFRPWAKENEQRVLLATNDWSEVSDFAANLNSTNVE
jgi:hypothetical protein